MALLSSGLFLSASPDLLIITSLMPIDVMMNPSIVIPPVLHIENICYIVSLRHLFTPYFLFIWGLEFSDTPARAPC